MKENGFVLFKVRVPRGIGGCKAHPPARVRATVNAVLILAASRLRDSENKYEDGSLAQRSTNLLKLYGEAKAKGIVQSHQAALES